MVLLILSCQIQISTSKWSTNGNARAVFTAEGTSGGIHGLPQIATFDGIEQLLVRISFIDNICMCSITTVNLQ